MKAASMLGRELKFVDSFHSTTVPKTVALSRVDPTTNNNLFAVAVGDGQSARIGRTTTLKSIYIQGHLNLPIAASHNGTYYYVTLWLVEDKQTNGAAMDPLDFLTSVNAQVDADAFQNLNESQRFRLLKKKTIRVPRYFTGGLDVPFNMYQKMDCKVQYKDTQATIDKVATSSFHLLAIGSEEMTTAMEISYQVRCRYFG